MNINNLIALFYLLCTLLLATACHRKNRIAAISIQPLPTEKQTDIEIPTDTLETAAIQVVERLHYGKTSCYGNCPVFFLKVFSDGTLQYNGIRNVIPLGFVEQKISEQVVIELIQTVEKNAFFDLAASYPINQQQLKELPNTIIQYNNGQQQHSVISNYDAPPAFQNIEKYLQQLLHHYIQTSR